MNTCDNHGIRYDHFLCPMCVENIRGYSVANRRETKIEPISPKLLEDIERQKANNRTNYKLYKTTSKTK